MTRASARAIATDWVFRAVPTALTNALPPRAVTRSAVPGEIPPACEVARTTGEPSVRSTAARARDVATETDPVPKIGPDNPPGTPRSPVAAADY